jgi:erythronate-4-phosphate dehydrogenase
VRIVADRNITDVEPAFSLLGDVEAVPSTEITPERVRDADLVLVRSTVKVGPALLAASRARFVATATIGTDHLDLPWLAQRGIAVASAPGSNAQSVAEWWLQALLHEDPSSFVAKTVGVVGVGQVGRRVARLAAALGMRVLQCDPPRAEAEADFTSVPLDELLPEVDVLTLHTPLTRLGPHATVGLLGAARLARLRSGAILVNSARGELCDGAATLAEAARLRLLLDVFPGEPAPDPALVAAARLATAHIAGHSLEGKLAGTLAVYRAACAFRGVAPAWTPTLPPRTPEQVVVDVGERGDEEALGQLLRLGYDQPADDRALRALAPLPPSERAAAWRVFRDGYAGRREMGGLRVALERSRPRLEGVLELLGVVRVSEGAR